MKVVVLSSTLYASTNWSFFLFPNLTCGTNFEPTQEMLSSLMDRGENMRQEKRGFWNQESNQIFLTHQLRRV